jgi:peptidoglycan/xylan/chitin deacetylase (PgdA/CDA1 family)/sulfur carrier protein ThiS
VSGIHHVIRPAEASPAAGLAIAFAAFAVGLLAVAGWATVPIRVVVDGRAEEIRAGSTVAELLASDLTLAPHGDLLGVNGSVARRGGGSAPGISVGGRSAGELQRIFPGAVVTGSRGRDVRERVVTKLVAVPIPTEESGRGPDLLVRQLGASGLARVTMGEVSRGVIRNVLIRPAVSMKITRRPFPAGTPIVALTFDDGPWPGQTERILEILRRDGVPATFFMVGGRVRLAPDLARTVLEQGHLVGNHTQSHLLLGHATPEQVTAQMVNGAATLRAILGIESRWFRAPGGALTPLVRTEAALLGERIAGWTVDPNDWRRPPADVIVARVVGAVRPGAVVLMHDGGGDRSATIAALPRVIEQLRVRGYRFVTLDGLATVN